MRASRRRVIQRGLASAIALGGIAPAPSRARVARDGGALVIVRTDLGIQALDPLTRSVTPWDGPLPAATSVAVRSATAPAAIATPVTEGAVGYWVSSPGGDAHVFRLDTDASSTWWWRREGSRPVALDLPADLDPAFPGGATARWFHGATIDARHLGAGTLRLLAVDIETGEIVLDRQLDRRLELAATAVSDDGAIVAHVQSATTGVAFRVADLRGGTRLFDTDVVEEPAIAAASSIELKVVADGDAVLAAAGTASDSPGAPPSTVCAMRAVSPNDITTTTLPGELVGISRRP